MTLSIVLASSILGSALAAPVPTTRPSVTLESSPASEASVELDAYVLPDSGWEDQEVFSRLRDARKVLAACRIGLARISVHWIDPGFTKIADDDIDETHEWGGMYRLAESLPSRGGVRIFFFDNYSISPFSAGIFSTSITKSQAPAGSPLVATAWMPNRQRNYALYQPESYSMEAHELGHILTDDGHDDGPIPNIMSQTSAIRTNSFLEDPQCSRMRDNIRNGAFR